MKEKQEIIKLHLVDVSEREISRRTNKARNTVVTLLITIIITFQSKFTSLFCVCRADNVGNVDNETPFNLYLKDKSNLGKIECALLEITTLL